MLKNLAIISVTVLTIISFIIGFKWVMDNPVGVREQAIQKERLY